MTGRLIYVIGPSGSGKDSVLGALRERWSLPHVAHWARRTITRPPGAQGEKHEAVDGKTFDALLRAQAFSFHWSANGLRYGIRQEELSSLAQGHWVFVNGSRGYLTELLQLRPKATIVHISASRSVLQARLMARGRETAQAIEERLARHIALDLPVGSIHIENDGELGQAVASLMERLLRRP